jgi:hypothetical protein
VRNPLISAICAASLISRMAWGQDAPEIQPLPAGSCAAAFEEVARPGAWRKVRPLLTKLLAREKTYTPITNVPAVGTPDVIKATLQNRARIAKLGGTYSNIEHMPTFLDDMDRRGWTHLMPGTDGMKYGGEMLQVQALPLAKAGSTAQDAALTHPLMRAALERMWEKGYNLVVDSSLSFTGAEAYFHPGKKIIAVRPDTPWFTFVHEMQHLEFNHEILKPGFLAPMREFSAAGKSIKAALPAEAIARIGEQKLDRIQRLLDKGITPDLALNETLSITEELQTIGWKRFIPGHYGTGAYQYMLRHQITELEKLGPAATLAQRDLIDSAKLRHAFTDRYDQLAPTAGAIAAPIAAYGAYAAITGTLDTPDPTREVLYNENGDFITRDRSGVRYYQAIPGPTPTTPSRK